jgi:YD repeat-containing protein
LRPGNRSLNLNQELVFTSYEISEVVERQTALQRGPQATIFRLGQLTLLTLAFIFSMADSPASNPNRRIFLTEVIDPQGHSVTLTYDSAVRLVAITDAIGQVTTLDYLDSADPLRLTKITDPFGRVATLTYDNAGTLATITEAIGMSSSFTYGDGDFITEIDVPAVSAGRRPAN